MPFFIVFYCLDSPVHMAEDAIRQSWVDNRRLLTFPGPNVTSSGKVETSWTYAGGHRVWRPSARFCPDRAVGRAPRSIVAARGEVDMTRVCRVRIEASAEAVEQVRAACCVRPTYASAAG